MPTVIFVGLLLVGLALGFYVMQKFKEFSRSNKRSTSNFLLSQARSQLRRFWSDLRSGNDSNDPST